MPVQFHKARGFQFTCKVQGAMERGICKVNLSLVEYR